MDMVEHLRSRNYETHRYPTTWLTDHSATFPLFDFSGKLKGYQLYNPEAPKKTDNPKEAKYFTRANGNNQLVWGLELEISRSIRSYRILN